MKVCGQCKEFVRATPISHWGECFKEKRSVRDNWECYEGRINMTANVVEGEKACHRCNGSGEREKRDGSKVTCETCHGTGRICEASSLCGRNCNGSR